MAINTRIESELRKIVDPYGIEVVDFTPIDGGNTNLNYHIQGEIPGKGLTDISILHLR